MHRLYVYFNNSIEKDYRMTMLKIASVIFLSSSALSLCFASDKSDKDSVGELSNRIKISNVQEYKIPPYSVSTPEVNTSTENVSRADKKRKINFVISSVGFPDLSLDSEEDSTTKFSKLDNSVFEPFSESDSCVLSSDKSGVFNAFDDFSAGITELAEREDVAMFPQNTPEISPITTPRVNDHEEDVWSLANIRKYKTDGPVIASHLLAFDDYEMSPINKWLDDACSSSFELDNFQEYFPQEDK